MTVARISNFLQNSDFTAQKQKNKIFFDLNIPAGNYKTGDSWQTVKDSPSGVFFENVTLKTSLEANYLSSNYTIILPNHEAEIFVSVHRLDANHYRLFAVFQRLMTPENSNPYAQIPNINIQAWLNLSISPF